MSAPLFHVQLLDPLIHRREGFHCESPELTDFLDKRASKEMAARASACFVLVPAEDHSRVAGYYTLSAAEIVASNLPGAVSKKLPRYPSLPATLLGRLARDWDFRGRGIGNLLMHDALSRAFASSAEIGSIAIVTDPKDDKAARFYQDFNFRPLAEGRLFLPMAEVRRLVDDGTS